MKKTTIGLCIAAIIAVGTAATARASIIAGPITNPANGHDYYLLSPGSWSVAESEAENLGGTLAIIKSTAEQEWVFAKFGAYGGTNRNLWIGLAHRGQNRSLIWPVGGEPAYANWTGGQPDDAGGIETAVFMASADRPWGFKPGGWADINDAGLINWVAPNGVVEVPGKSNEKTLSAKEKSLIGTWYESGNPERPAWIVGTENKVFLITHDRHAARLILTPEGMIYDADRQYGEVVKDKVVWSNGTWWSRAPAHYEAATNKPGAVEAMKSTTSPVLPAGMTD